MYSRQRTASELELSEPIQIVTFAHLPADMHSHLRQGALMEAMVAYSAWLTGYEGVEPNTNPPIVTAADARAYKARILGAPTGIPTYRPQMGVYLSTESDPDDIALGFREGDIAFIKWYPPHGTTGSHLSVPLFSPTYCRIADMAEREGVPFQHHGELTHDNWGEELDEQDRESYFYVEKFPEHRRRWPGIRFFGEHLTTKDGVSAILGDEGCCGTITPWHLLTDRRIRDRGGSNPLYALKPALKRQAQVEALRNAIKQRSPRLFAGSDRAPHPRGKKSQPVGCACGIYSPAWIEWYATAFEDMDMLDYLETFLCLNGPRCYRLEPIRASMHLLKKRRSQDIVPIRFGTKRNDVVLPFGYHPNRKAPADIRLKLYWWVARDA